MTSCEGDFVHFCQEEVCSCPVCMEMFNRPRMLPCQHTICQNCLKDYISERKSSSRVKSIPCPICRQAVPLPHHMGPEDIAKSFPLNHLIVSLMDSADKLLDDREACSIHMHECLDHFCLTHRRLLCGKCNDGSEHRNCNVLHVNDYAKTADYQTYRYKMVESLRMCRARICEVNKFTDNCQDTLHQNKDTVFAEINNSISDGKANLKRIEQKLKTEATISFDLEGDRLKLLKANGQRVLSDIDKIERRMKCVQKLGNVRAVRMLLDVEQTLLSNLAILQDMEQDSESVTLNLSGPEQGKGRNSIESYLTLETVRRKMTSERNASADNVKHLRAVCKPAVLSSGKSHLKVVQAHTRKIKHRKHREETQRPMSKATSNNQVESPVDYLDHFIMQPLTNTNLELLHQSKIIAVILFILVSIAFITMSYISSVSIFCFAYSFMLSLPFDQTHYGVRLRRLHYLAYRLGLHMCRFVFIVTIWALFIYSVRRSGSCFPVTVVYHRHHFISSIGEVFVIVQGRCEEIVVLFQAFVSYYYEMCDMLRENTETFNVWFHTMLAKA